MYDKLLETVETIAARYPKRARIGLILGSGLGSYADILENKAVIPFEDLPHFPKSTVLGHSGNLVLGESEGVPMVVLQGRVHFYEGYSFADITYPVRVLGCLGVRQLIITNAAGAIKLDFCPGDLMLITDHINLMGGNPLIGPNVDELGPRFPDMSTVPEVIVANHMAMRVLGISCITNMAAGILPRKLAHQEVMDITERANKQFVALLQEVVYQLGSQAHFGGGSAE
jgi:purine-nucleoside phosphorylase